MKVLILSCNTGGGHNSCARAIGTELQRRGHTYETDDALLYVSKGTSRFVSNWHVRFYRYFPKLYNKGYQYAEEHPASFDESSAACRILRRGCKRLRAAIVQGGYDAVVCVHLFPALMLTFIQRQQPLPVRSSIRTLFSFVSLCVVRSVISPAAWRSRSFEQSAPRRRMNSSSGPTAASLPARSSFAARSNAARRETVLWKFGIVSFNRPSRSARSFWKHPNAEAASNACSGVSRMS